MKKNQSIENLETAIYVIALTAARDEEGTKEDDKQALSLIREYMNELLILKNANPNFITLSTIGMSEVDGMKLAKELRI